jgi:transcriptional regulator with XRE-family HTH domain
MADKKKLSLEQFTEKVGAEAPNFARALQEEDAYLQFCRKVREDLKQLREDMRIKQSEVAAELQMSQPGVSKIENGEGDIGLLTLCRYAGALGMQPTIAFAPAASTYMEQDHLKLTVRAIEKLSESRLARADSSVHDRYKRLAALSAMTSAPMVPASAMMGALASAMSSAMAQSLSTEIASMMSAFSDVEVVLDEAPKLPEKPRGRGNVAAT